MRDRERQLTYDRLAAEFLAALEDGDFDAAARIWNKAATDPDLEDALTDAAHALAETDEQAIRIAAENMLEHAVRVALPTAEVVRPATGSLTVADVADHLRRCGTPGLSSADLALNDTLARCADPLPEDLGLSTLIAWGARYGAAPEAYWKAFRAAALTLMVRRESASGFKLAARPARPRRKGGDA